MALSHLARSRRRTAAVSRIHTQFPRSRNIRPGPPPCMHSWFLHFSETSLLLKFRSVTTTWSPVSRTLDHNSFCECMNILTLIQLRRRPSYGTFSGATQSLSQWIQISVPLSGLCEPECEAFLATRGGRPGQQCGARQQIASDTDLIRAPVVGPNNRSTAQAGQRNSNTAIGE